MTQIITDTALNFLESLTMSLDVSRVVLRKGHGDVFIVEERVLDFKVYLEEFDIGGMLADEDMRSLWQSAMTFSAIDGFFNVANLVKARGIFQPKIDFSRPAAVPNTLSKTSITISGGVSLEESINVDELLQISPFTKDLPTINPFSINIDRIKKS
jgi:hypothetical protein